MPPGQWSYDETIRTRPRSAKAGELLKKAGVAEGFEITLWAVPKAYEPQRQADGGNAAGTIGRRSVSGEIVAYRCGANTSSALGRRAAGAMLIGRRRQRRPGQLDSAPSAAATRWTLCFSNGCKFTTNWSRMPKRTPTRASAPSCTKQASTSSQEQVPITPIAHSAMYRSRCAARRYTTSGSVPSTELVLQRGQRRQITSPASRAQPRHERAALLGRPASPSSSERRSSMRPLLPAL